MSRGSKINSDQSGTKSAGGCQTPQRKAREFVASLLCVICVLIVERQEIQGVFGVCVYSTFFLKSKGATKKKFIKFYPLNKA